MSSIMKRRTLSDKAFSVQLSGHPESQEGFPKGRLRGLLYCNIPTYSSVSSFKGKVHTEFSHIHLEGFADVGHIEDGALAGVPIAR